MRKSVLAGASALALVAGIGGAAAADAASSNASNAPAKTTSVAPAIGFARGWAGFESSSSGLFLFKQKGLLSFSRIGLGTYDIRFNRNITSCAWTGSIGFPVFGGSTPNNSGIQVTGRAGTNNGLFVTTYVGTASVDLPFTVLVTCG